MRINLQMAPGLGKNLESMMQDLGALFCCFEEIKGFGGAREPAVAFYGIAGQKVKHMPLSEILGSNGFDLETPEAPVDIQAERILLEERESVLDETKIVLAEGQKVLKADRESLESDKKKLVEEEELQAVTAEAHKKLVEENKKTLDEAQLVLDDERKSFDEKILQLEEDKKILEEEKVRLGITSESDTPADATTPTVEESTEGKGNTAPKDDKTLKGGKANEAKPAGAKK